MQFKKLNKHLAIIFDDRLNKQRTVSFTNQTATIIYLLNNNLKIITKFYTYIS